VDKEDINQRFGEALIPFSSCSSGQNLLIKGVNPSRTSSEIYKCSVNPPILKAISLKFPLSLLNPLGTYQWNTYLA
jgi:hypothetical protein